MMRKSLFLLIFLLSITNAHADIKGYDWEELDLNTKTALVHGYLGGYIYGYISGELQGSTETFIKITEFETASIVDVKEQNKISMKHIEPYQKHLESQSKLLKEKINVFFEKKVVNYVKEIDSFFQTFPLCKKENFSNLISQFMTLWKNNAFKNNQDRKITYKTIGERCIN